ncbi:MAG: SGNH/GDSL hydrolase family protein [bacterium]|nr:SGNH/GDSL hydrolase family protein [bacterium]
MGTKKKLKNIVLFGISLAISLIAIEIFLRFCQISLPSIVINHDKLGRVFRRNAALMVLNEGLYLGKINKYGYTGHAYPPQRDNDALRIALVGDSYVQGHYMVDCYYFGRVMEEKLEGLLKREVEVLNFGIAGSDLPRMYIRYKVQASKYKPDITLFILGPNDLLKRDKNLGGKCVLENGELKMNFDFSKSRSYKFKTRYKVFRNFAFYPLMQKAYAMVRVGKAPDILLDKLNPFESKKKKTKAFA